MKRANSPLADCEAAKHDQRMEKMTIRLISLVEDGSYADARLEADASDIGVRVSLEVRLRVYAGTQYEDWKEEAYNRALLVLDPA